MSRIDLTFQRLKKESRAALVIYIVAGDPSLDMTEAMVLKMAECGADIIELGVPFSDPLADGPVIQAAAQRALQKGVTLQGIFRMAERLKEISTPLVLMTYFNPVLRYGLKNFAEDCHKNEIAGVIIPDLPPEEAGPWIQEARPLDLDTIFLTAPTSSAERIKLVDRCSRGFIYHVSVTGVTGSRGTLPEDLEGAVKQIREYSKKPVAVGFGISTPAQARAVSLFADGVIVGSAMVKIVQENLTDPDLVRKGGDFVSSLSHGLKP
jgi:tryptophan synthase alpha chain